MKQILKKQKNKARPYKPLRQAVVSRFAVYLSLNAAMSAMNVAHLNMQRNDKMDKAFAIFNAIINSASAISRNALLLAKARKINK